MSHLIDIRLLALSDQRALHIQDTLFEDMPSYVVEVTHDHCSTQLAFLLRRLAYLRKFAPSSIR